MLFRNLTHGINGLILYLADHTYPTIDSASFNNGEQKKYRATQQEEIAHRWFKIRVNSYKGQVGYHGRCASIRGRQRTWMEAYGRLAISHFSTVGD